MRRARARALGFLGTCVSIACLASTAGAAPSAVDIALNIGASVRASPTTLVANGGTATMARRNFYVFLSIDLVTPAPGGRPKLRFELGGGLQWGADDPDAAEFCTSTPTTGECQTPDLQPVTGQSGGGWYWDVVAPGNGTYTFSAVIAEAPEPDPDLSNNSSTITIVVDESSSSGGGGGSGGSGGSGDSAAAKASIVKLSPLKPKAGSTLVASVRVTRGGSPVRPRRVVCAASIRGVKVKGEGRAKSGVASCLFKTPTSAKGRRMTGSVSFRASGAVFTKRFATKLG